jgi:hypothetical protein
MNIDNSIKTLKKKAISLPNYLNKTSSSYSNKKTTNEFIFFGCWNNINCKKKNTDRDIVLHLLKSLYQNYKIILAGDNWYNQKVNKITYKDSKDKVLKYYPLYILHTGYKLLFDISRNVDIVLGNHDINPDNAISKGNIIDNFCNNLGCMLYVQNNVIAQTLKLKEGIDLNLGMETINKDVKDVYNYPDSNVVLYSCKPKLIKQNKGIYFLYINTNVFETSVDIITKYKQLIQFELLNVHKKIKLLFIVGHHPFAGLKEKKKDFSIKNISELYFKNNKEKTNIIYGLLDLFVKYKSVYLCADIHSFQICKLHPNICMVIVGSGGANADIVAEEFIDINYINNGIPFNLYNSINSYAISDLYIHNPYGFSKISYDKKTFDITIQYYNVKEYEDQNITYSIYSYLLKNTEDSWFIEKLENDLNKHIIIETIINPSKTYCNLFKIKTGTEEEIIKELIESKIIASNNGKDCGIKK